MEKWSKLKIGTDQYIAKLNRKDADNLGSCTLWLSDFKTLWSESFTDKFDLIQRLADSNPALNIDDEIGEKLISEIFAFESAKIDAYTNDDDEIHLQHSLTDEMGCTFQWLLKKRDAQVFFEQITKPLLQQIGEMEDNEKVLIEIINKKDAEINQYKLEGAPELNRKKYITEKFDDTKYTSPSKVFNCSIDSFEGMISPLSKKIAKREESISPQKPTFVPTNLVEARTGRNRMQTQYRQPTSLDVEYDVSDDDGDQSIPMESSDLIAMETAAAVLEPVKPSPKKSTSNKRIKRIKDVL
ncbi:uncharacterized protein LOC116341647 [Contarinia nasturtii]|uniref:uncharacterized protein LOC116341647 n=1 Tax=Contarinia nasturtii TaxID=265458 RepID=UPI0012D47276|nr:uncharacterized protein LOC116341647 [Contarinia nasturtii]